MVKLFDPSRDQIHLSSAKLWFIVVC